MGGGFGSGGHMGGRFGGGHMGMGSRFGGHFNGFVPRFAGRSVAIGRFDPRFGHFDRDDRFRRFGRFDRDDRFFFRHGFRRGLFASGFPFWGWGGGWGYPYSDNAYSGYNYPGSDYSYSTGSAAAPLWIGGSAATGNRGIIASSP